MPKFECFVMQTTRNKFIIEAPDQETAEERAIDAFNAAKNLDFDTDVDSNLITPGRKLDMQVLDEKRLFWYTHFDCWNDDEDCDKPMWKWDAAKAVDLAWRLMTRAAFETDCDDFLKLDRDTYLKLGQVQFFEKVAEIFISFGYDVYNSDTYFEVYHPHKLEVES
jgi:hypothetical protein